MRHWRTRLHEKQSWHGHPAHERLHIGGTLMPRRRYFRSRINLAWNPQCPGQRSQPSRDTLFKGRSRVARESLDDSDSFDEDLDCPLRTIERLLASDVDDKIPAELPDTEPVVAWAGTAAMKERELSPKSSNPIKGVSLVIRM